jgi:hypothetical protein
MKASHVFLGLSFLSLLVAVGKPSPPPHSPLTLPGLFLTRRIWLPRIPTRTQIASFFTERNAYLPLPRFRPGGSFAADIEGGFSSSNFDLTDNVLNGDQRAGLDDGDKTAISRIMAVKKVGFDEARRILAQTRMEKNGIDPRTGRPLDPRAVMFS